MANVLPPQDRTTLRRNYWLRLTTVITFIIAASMAIGLVALVPAYLSAQAQLNAVTQYQELQGETREADKSDTTIQTARFVNFQIEELLKTQHTSATRAITLVMRDWEVHAEDIIISGFNYDLLEGKDESISKLRISGEARDRAVLNAFVQTLRSDSAFTSVSFPVSDLAGAGTLDFSLIVLFES